MEKKDAIQLVLDELDLALEKFPLFNSAHEGYAVIKEEFDELWDEIKNNKNPDSKRNQKNEAKQLAAVGIKFLMSCCELHY